MGTKELNFAHQAAVWRSNSKAQNERSHQCDDFDDQVETPDSQHTCASEKP